jgi:hypothetical protein
MGMVYRFNMLSATLTFAQTHDCDITEQYVDWGNNINFIFMRDQNQEGGTSTPGKRPGCSEHALTCLNYFKLHFKDFRICWGLSNEYGDYGVEPIHNRFRPYEQIARGEVKKVPILR